MTTPEAALKLILRIVGSVSLLAAIFVFVPYSWMDGIHRWLGMGSLPDVPVVGYLARSTSAFYALLGGLLWVLSSDPGRYRPVLIYLAMAVILFGLMLLGIDWVEGMPLFWRLVEGPYIIILGLAMLLLSRRLKQSAEGS
jgi:hypothetical protein